MAQKQEDKVKARIREVGYVDNFWAIENYVLRLGAIIHNLRKQGWVINGSFGIGKDRKNYFYRPVRGPVAKQDNSINGVQPFAVKKEKPNDDKNKLL